MTTGHMVLFPPHTLYQVPSILGFNSLLLLKSSESITTSAHVQEVGSVVMKLNMSQVTDTKIE